MKESAFSSSTVDLTHLAFSTDPFQRDFYALSLSSLSFRCRQMGVVSDEERLLRELLKIEKHEDRMITAMVQLTVSNEQLNKRLTGLTWVMLILTWITFVIAIPNTLATIFGIPKVSEALGLEVMIATLIVSTAGALFLVIFPGSSLSLSKLEKRLGRKIKHS